MKIYVSGPISSDTSRTLEQKQRRFAFAAELLRANGYDAVDPFEIGPACDDHSCLREPEIVPLVSEAQGEHSWHCYLKADLISLLHCDGIALLDGWEASRGAQLEITTGQAVGIRAEPLSAWVSQLCARCRQPRQAHLGDGPRRGCSFAGLGETTTCALCAAHIVWDGQYWRDDHAHGEACPVSADSFPAHVPANAGDLR